MKANTDLEKSIEKRIAEKKILVDRWENSIDHSYKSKELYEKIAAIDWLCFGDSFGFKSGGDGDNGETMMYILDILFEVDR